MKIRTLLASVLLAVTAGATLGIAHASAWSATLNGDARCTPAPRTAADTWVVTWGYTNTDSHPEHAVITAEADEHSADQQLVGHDLAPGEGGFLVVTYPAAAKSDTLKLTFTWKDAQGHVLDHKTVSAKVTQPEGCDVYAPPTVPEPAWQQQICGADGVATPASFTTEAVAGVHYDDVIDGVHVDNQPAGKHVVAFTDHDVEVFVQAWDDTSGALIHQWSHTFTYIKCTSAPPTTTQPAPPSSSTRSQPVPPVTAPSTHRPVSSSPKSTAAAKVQPAKHSSPAPSATGSTAQLAYTGSTVPTGKLTVLAAVLVALGVAMLTVAAVRYRRLRGRAH